MNRSSLIWGGPNGLFYFKKIKAIHLNLTLIMKGTILYVWKVMEALCHPLALRND